MFIENAVRTKVLASTSPVLLVVALGKSCGRLYYNDSASDLYLMFGTAGTTSDFSVKIAAGGTWGMDGTPFIYTGPVYGAWDTADGKYVYITTFS